MLGRGGDEGGRGRVISHRCEFTEPAALNKNVLKQHKVPSPLTASRHICQSDSAAFSLGNDNWKLFDGLNKDLPTTISKSKTGERKRPGTVQIKVHMQLKKKSIKKLHPFLRRIAFV